MAEITNQMLLSEIKEMAATNELTHGYLKEGIDAVTQEVKEFRESNSANAVVCRKELHGRITEVALKQANANGRRAQEDLGKAPKTRKADWVKDNWKIILLLCFLSAAGGNQILPYIGKLLGIK